MDPQSQDPSPVPPRSEEPEELSFEGALAIVWDRLVGIRQILTGAGLAKNPTVGDLLRVLDEVKAVQYRHAPPRFPMLNPEPVALNEEREARVDRILEAAERQLPKPEPWEKGYRAPGDPPGESDESPPEIPDTLPPGM